MRKLGLSALLVFLLTQEAQGAPIFLYPGQNVDFGEALLNNALLQGAVTINPFTGAVARSNVTLITPAVGGTFVMEGNDLLPVILTVTAGALACDATYVTPCTGTPTITVNHNSPGYITGNFCPKRPKCQDTVTVGGTFTYPANAQGRWTTTITIIANYQ